MKKVYKLLIPISEELANSEIDMEELKHLYINELMGALVKNEAARLDELIMGTPSSSPVGFLGYHNEI